MCTVIIEAQADGYGPAPDAARSASDIVTTLFEGPLLDGRQHYANDISDYYLSAYRHMIARGSPVGIELKWLATANLFRDIGDAYAERAAQLSSPQPAANKQELLRDTQPSVDILRQIARFVDPTFVRQAKRTIDAVAHSLDHEADANPLSDDDRQLLNLLISGHTVDEIAGQLELSSRTIHRRLQTVWDQVGATTRTHGIAVITARGWLD